eukprot:TRINITY_DN21118_c0_g1_i1.p1 TRINITY_DN21118_c0_g1~~TRINITY_DN21118_c0_g1_i1.p1  ORF type:complete len:735 (-),score=76.75 TRINITY_DN21118_c0_g1_i1:33-2237(-)
MKARLVAALAVPGSILVLISLCCLACFVRRRLRRRAYTATELNQLRSDFDYIQTPGVPEYDGDVTDNSETSRKSKMVRFMGLPKPSYLSSDTPLEMPAIVGGIRSDWMAGVSRRTSPDVLSASQFADFVPQATVLSGSCTTPQSSRVPNSSGPTTAELLVTDSYLLPLLFLTRVPRERRVVLHGTRHLGDTVPPSPWQRPSPAPLYTLTCLVAASGDSPSVSGAAHANSSPFASTNTLLSSSLSVSGAVATSPPSGLGGNPREYFARPQGAVGVQIPQPMDRLRQHVALGRMVDDHRHVLKVLATFEDMLPDCVPPQAGKYALTVVTHHFRMTLAQDIAARELLRVHHLERQGLEEPANARLPLPLYGGCLLVYYLLQICSGLEFLQAQTSISRVAALTPATVFLEPGDRETGTALSPWAVRLRVGLFTGSTPCDMLVYSPTKISLQSPGPRLHTEGRAGGLGHVVDAMLGGLHPLVYQNSGQMSQRLANILDSLLEEEWSLREAMARLAEYLWDEGRKEPPVVLDDVHIARDNSPGGGAGQSSEKNVHTPHSHAGTATAARSDSWTSLQVHGRGGALGKPGGGREEATLTATATLTVSSQPESLLGTPVATTPSNGERHSLLGSAHSGVQIANGLGAEPRSPPALHSSALLQALQVEGDSPTVAQRQTGAAINSVTYPTIAEQQKGIGTVVANVSGNSPAARVKFGRPNGFLSPLPDTPPLFRSAEPVASGDL